MQYVRKSLVLATTHPIGAYGGIQFDRDAMEALADAVRRGRLPFRFNHDARRAIPVKNIVTGVRERSDGEWEAWAECDVPAALWTAWEDELAVAGAPGGMSFSMTVSRVAIDGDPESPLRASLHADAAHYTSSQITAAAERAADRTAETRAGYIYQFAHLPDPAVVFEISGQLLHVIPPDLLPAWLYDILSTFLARDADGAPEVATPKFDILIEESPGSKKMSAHIETTSDEELRHAMKDLLGWVSRQGTIEYEDGSWRHVGEADDDDELTSGE